MKDNKENHQNDIETVQNTEELLNNVVSIIDLIGIKNRINTISQCFDKTRLLEALNIILDGVSELTDAEYDQVAMYIREKIKEGLPKGKPAPLPKQIVSTLKHHLRKDKDWDHRTFIGEENGEIYALVDPKKNKKVIISNFTLTPTYTVTVQDGDKYHMYDVKVKDDPRTYSIKLTAADFNKLDTLQQAIRMQLAHTSALLHNCAGYIADVSHRYVTLAKFDRNQLGTSLLGLERFENDGPKYFCSPTGIYGLDGKASAEIVFMGNEQSNQDELRNLTNLEYDAKKWKKVIAPVFLRNITKINEKWSMLSLLGWMGAIPHDYVVRKEAKTGFFPHAHIVGEPGSGKSTIMTIFKQFMGHNDGTPRTFPTPFETSKLLNSSYTIPVVLDEYGKRWNPGLLESMNKILVESFTKARWSRGQSNLGSVYFKYKNPILMGGQIPTSDQALAARIIPISVYKAYHNTKAGKKSFNHLTQIQKMEDKNFWVGYNLWCAQHSNEEVESVYAHYRTFCRGVIDENRIADIYAVVMLGLHFMHKLALELGLTEEELGYTNAEIKEMAGKLSSTSAGADSQETPLTLFLRSLTRYSVSIGNSSIHGNYFGRGRAVMETTPVNQGSGEYGNKNHACIYGKNLILVQVDEMVSALNKNKKRDLFSEHEIMTFIDAEFKRSMQDPHAKDNLVLAPKQYKNKFGRYTAFHKETLEDIYGEIQAK